MLIELLKKRYDFMGYEKKRGMISWANYIPARPMIVVNIGRHANLSHTCRFCPESEMKSVHSLIALLSLKFPTRTKFKNKKHSENADTSTSVTFDLVA